MSFTLTEKPARYAAKFAPISSGNFSSSKRILRRIVEPLASRLLDQAVAGILGVALYFTAALRTATRVAQARNRDGAAG